MKVAIIGSRNLTVDDLTPFLPKSTTEIVSGGAKGIDQCAARCAYENNIKLTEFLPQYDLYKKAAPLKRNLEIINYADMVIAFWDGRSKGTKYVIDNSKKAGKELLVIALPAVN